jgi:hypothetical protein
MKNRLMQALLAYALLVIAAFFLLSGLPLMIILGVFAIFATRTVLWHFKPED